MNKYLKQHLKNCWIGYTFVGLYSLQIVTQLYLNSKFRDIGEEWSVREIRKQRVFYPGQGHIFYFDNNSDGVLDVKYANLPVHAKMGAVGWMLFQKSIEDEDLRRFGRANELLRQKSVTRR